jgi:hypothetical protein
MIFAMIYMAALAVWILVASTIWSAAGLMCVVPRTRALAWPMSLALAATFPFAFVYQIMAASVILTMLLGALRFRDLLNPVSTIKNPVVIGGFIIAIFGSAIIMFAASVTGFADGWRTGLGERLRQIHERADG